jgi:hypothetical protein
MPRAKMVGNMIDIKIGPQDANPGHPAQFEEDEQTEHRIDGAIQTKSLGGDFLRRPVPMNRPPRKRSRPTDTKLEAPLLLKAIAPVVRISVKPFSQCFKKSGLFCTAASNVRGHVINKKAENANLSGQRIEIRQ